MAVGQSRSAKLNCLNDGRKQSCMRRELTGRPLRPLRGPSWASTARNREAGLRDCVAVRASVAWLRGSAVRLFFHQLPFRIY